MTPKINDSVILFNTVGEYLTTVKVIKVEKDVGTTEGYHIYGERNRNDYFYFHPDYGDYVIPKELLDSEIGQIIWI